MVENLHGPLGSVQNAYRKRWLAVTVESAFCTSRSFSKLRADPKGVRFGANSAVKICENNLSESEPGSNHSRAVASVVTLNQRNDISVLVDRRKVDRRIAESVEHLLDIGGNHFSPAEQLPEAECGVEWQPFLKGQEKELPLISGRAKPGTGK